MYGIEVSWDGNGSKISLQNAATGKLKLHLSNAAIGQIKKRKKTRLLMNILSHVCLKCRYSPPIVAFLQTRL